MLKQKIKFVDFNGQEREQEFYFNLTRSEVTEMELSVDGGFVEKIKRMIETKNAEEIMKTFKEFILKAYGEKSADGLRFVKSEELSIAFSQTMAYDDLFMRLVTDGEAAAKFVNGVIPNPVVAE